MASAKPVLIATRILDYDRTALAADNADYTVNKGTKPNLIYVVQLDEEKGTWTSTYKLQWVNTTDAGTMADLAATGEINWAATTSLVQGTAVTARSCTATGGSGSTWQNGEEVEGASTSDSINLADEYYTEIHFAINCALAIEGKTYDFRVIESGGGTSINTFASSLIITSDQPSVVLNTADLTEFATSTPTLEFTGTDASDSDVRYNIQIDTVNSFDSQSETNSYLNSDATVVDATSNYRSQSFKMTQSGLLTSCKFKLRYGTAPDSVDMYAYLYAQTGSFGDGSTDKPTGSILATSGVVNSNVLTASLQEITFTFSGAQQYPIVANTAYHICYFSTADYRISAGTTSPPAGSRASSDDGSTWVATSTADLQYSVTIARPLLDKVSGTDAGFDSTVNPGVDTDPFNSGDKCDYDVQVGEELPDGTYYWRVRGMDPSPGSGSYGSWAATRSFTVVSGGGDQSVSKTEKTTVRDISTVQFDLFNAPGIDKATVRDIVSIFLSVIFLSKTDKATIQDIATIVLGELLPITPSDLTEYATTQDVLTIILDVLCPSKTDKATVKDVLTVYFDRWLASKADTATIKDTLAIFLDLLFISKADTATVRDVLTVLLNKLNLEGVDTITTQDVLTVILDKFNVSKADTATARDVLSVILDAFIPSFTDKATLQEIAAVMLDKMLVSSVDTATIQDTFTLVFDKLIQHSTETLTVQDIITLQMNLYNMSGIDKATLQDISALILDKLNVPGIDQASVRDVFTLIFDKFLVTGIDYATTQDIATLLLWFESYQIGRGDYSTLRDRVLISLSGIAGTTIYHIPTIPNLGSFSGRIGGRKHISLG